MKRLTSLLLLLCILITFCSCESQEIDEPAVSIVEKEDVKQEDKPLTKEERNTTPAVSEVKPEPEPEPEPQVDLPAELAALTVDSIFSQHEVIIVTSGDKTEYTLSDFPEADAFHIVDRKGYFGEYYYPEYVDKTVLGLLLNEPSKENTLETAKKLMANSNVVYACPSCDQISSDKFFAILTDEAAGQKYDAYDFPELSISINDSNYRFSGRYYGINSQEREEKAKEEAKEMIKNIRYVTMKASDGSIGNTYAQMKLALNDEKIRGIVPLYKKVDERDITVYVNVKISPENFTMEYFPYLDGEIMAVDTHDDPYGVLDGSVYSSSYNKIQIRLNNKGKRNVLDALALVEADERVTTYDSYQENHVYLGLD